MARKTFNDLKTKFDMDNLDNLNYLVDRLGELQQDFAFKGFDPYVIAAVVNAWEFKHVVDLVSLFVLRGTKHSKILASIVDTKGVEALIANKGIKESVKDADRATALTLARIASVVPHVTLHIVNRYKTNHFPGITAFEDLPAFLRCGALSGIIPNTEWAIPFKDACTVYQICFSELVMKGKATADTRAKTKTAVEAALNSNYLSGNARKQLFKKAVTAEQLPAVWKVHMIYRGVVAYNADNMDGLYGNQNRAETTPEGAAWVADVTLRLTARED